MRKTSGFGWKSVPDATNRQAKFYIALLGRLGLLSYNLGANDLAVASHVAAGIPIRAS
jgi:hypothetical protein